MKSFARSFTFLALSSLIGLSGCVTTGTNNENAPQDDAFERETEDENAVEDEETAAFDGALIDP